MKLSKKTSIIGHFAFNCDLNDGQTVKTRILYNELKLKGINNIYCVDTYLYKTNKIKLIFQTFISIATCSKIIVLLSENGMRVYFPVLFLAKKILRRNIYHDVIGGNLLNHIKSNPKYLYYLNCFDYNWVELSKMKKDLEEIGLLNCEVVPNFKRLDFKDTIININDDSIHKFCIFSRVTKEKGISEAIIAISNYNKNSKIKATLNIWGKIDINYKKEFYNLVNNSNGYVEYKGEVEYTQSIKFITNHIALLFPTYWSGEGFPGTIIDAYSAALPVIASDWNANSELVLNFKTGWIYPNDSIKDLEESIKWAIENTEYMKQMRVNCLKKAIEYLPDKHISKIINFSNLES